MDAGQVDLRLRLSLVVRPQRRDLIDDIIRRGVENDLSQATYDMKMFDEDLAHLHAGTGRWQPTPAGVAARALTAARAQHAQSERRAAAPDLGRFQRRHAIGDLTKAARTVDAALQAWDRHGRPEADQLGRLRAELVSWLDVLNDTDAARQAWLDQRPHLAEHQRRLDDQLSAPHRRGAQQMADLAPRAVSYDIDIGL